VNNGYLYDILNHISEMGTAVHTHFSAVSSPVPTKSPYLYQFQPLVLGFIPPYLPPYQQSTSIIKGASNADRLKRQKEYHDRMQRQIKLMQDTPGLAMMVNPKSLTFSYSPTLDYAMGRKSVITSMWLEQPMKLNATGSTSAFILTPGINRGGGLSHEFRVSTHSYSNLMSLISIFKNNGCVMDDDHSAEGVVMRSGSLYIYYDKRFYIGSFDSLSIRDDASKPFNLEYSYTYNVRQMLTLGVES